MIEVVGIRFKNGGKVYFFDPGSFDIEYGQNVIVETSRGIEFGHCAETKHEVDDTQVIQPLRPVVRLATEEDEKIVEENRQKEKEAFQLCEERIAHHNLDMKLVEVEYNFDRSKILFFFTSDGRVDFRELVKDLAGVFRTRIELRQIGVRDEAKLLGGIGICGRPFCCSSFLDEFQPVSIKMAKTQNLSLNPAKISGTCGRLMCCLKYEQDAYEDLVQRMPKVNSTVETPSGPGIVSEVNLLRETVKVNIEGQEDKKTYKYDTENKICLPVEEKTKNDIFSSPFLDNLLFSDPVEETQEEKTVEQSRRSNRRKRKKSHGSSSQNKNPDCIANSQDTSEISVTEALSAVIISEKRHVDKVKKPNNYRRKKAPPGNTKQTKAEQKNTKPIQTQLSSPQKPSTPAPNKKNRHNKYRGRAGNRPPLQKDIQKGNLERSNNP